MAVFVELTTDPFEANYKRLKDRNDPSLSRPGRAGLTNVRRPLRGLEIKEDTYASIKVIRADGSEVSFKDSSSATGESRAYSNFILQSVQEARMEKHQIIETFGEPYIYFFGEAPRFLDVQAVLINSNDFNWEAEWWHNWEYTLRGTRSVEQGARTYLFYDDNVIEGYMLMAQAVKTSTEPFMVQLTWRMFVSSYRNVSFVGDPNFPVHASVNLPPDVSLTDADAYGELTQAYRSASDVQEQNRAWGEEVAREANPTKFGSRNRLADTLRRGTRSVAFPGSVQAYIDYLRTSNQQDLPDLDTFDRLHSRPLRSLISDNYDEYTGSGNTHVDYLSGTLPEVFDPRIRGQLEVDDLFKEAISWMACFGANINSYTALAGLGMGVKFSASAGVGIGLGVGASASVGATFGAVARAGVGFGGSAGQGFGWGAGAGAGFTAGMFAGPGTYGSAGASAGRASNGFAPMLAPPGSSATPGQLAVGAGAGVLFSAGAGTRKTGLAQQTPLDTGFGDPRYGYPSPYGGPGFGQAGYGDYGGLGFGASFGVTGDPGFLPPSSFTFAGVADDRSDLERLLQRRPGYGAGFGGVGAGASFAGQGAGAGVFVGGSVSAFAMYAAPGTLYPDGNALTATGRRLGRAPANPYNVPCLNTFRVNGNLLSLL